jgi:hypothetical protein
MGALEQSARRLTKLATTPENYREIVYTGNLKTSSKSPTAALSHQANQAFQSSLPSEA